MDARHPLFGARLRADRAKMPIRSLKRHLQRWAELHWEYIHIVTDADGYARMDPAGHVAFEPTSDMPIEILGKASLWIGETVYNLRGALDYLVYALAVAGNKGRDVKGTQFPIEDSMDVFAGRVSGVNAKTGEKVKPCLRHVPDFAVARIVELQPGWSPPCEWTRTLRDLSNPDKHRFLTELRSKAELVAGGHPHLDNVDDADRRHPHLVVQVFFRRSGEDVVDTLELLQREVSSLIKEFEPVFKRTG